MKSNCCDASVTVWSDTEGRCNDCQEPCGVVSEAVAELEKAMYKASVVAYNLERSFADNCKEISGNGLTAAEAREKWGIAK